MPIYITEPDQTAIIKVAGPIGPQGPTGPTGPQGPTGPEPAVSGPSGGVQYNASGVLGGDSGFIYKQTSPNNQVLINGVTPLANEPLSIYGETVGYNFTALAGGVTHGAVGNAQLVATGLVVYSPESGQSLTISFDGSTATFSTDYIFLESNGGAVTLPTLNSTGNASPFLYTDASGKLYVGMLGGDLSYMYPLSNAKVVSFNGGTPFGTLAGMSAPLSLANIGNSTGDISQWTNDSGYITLMAVNWANLSGTPPSNNIFANGAGYTVANAVSGTDPVGTVVTNGQVTTVGTGGITGTDPIGNVFTAGVLTTKSTVASVSGTDAIGTAFTDGLCTTIGLGPLPYTSVTGLGTLATQSTVTTGQVTGQLPVAQVGDGTSNISQWSNNSGYLAGNAVSGTDPVGTVVSNGLVTTVGVGPAGALNGTYTISASLGGSVTFVNGICTAWTPAS